MTIYNGIEDVMKEFIIPMSDTANDEEIAELYGENRQLIRCKDCKYYDMFDGVFPWCSRWNKGSTTDPDGYCFLAERKENYLE